MNVYEQESGLCAFFYIEKYVALKFKALKDYGASDLPKHAVSLDDFDMTTKFLLSIYQEISTVIQIWEYDRDNYPKDELNTALRTSIGAVTACATLKAPGCYEGDEAHHFFLTALGEVRLCANPPGQIQLGVVDSTYLPNQRPEGPFAPGRG